MFVLFNFLRNMTVNGMPCKLGRILDPPLSRVAMGTHGNDAPGAGKAFSVKWDEVEINPRVLAFLLISKAYEWFGIEHGEIPFTERINNKLVINLAHLQALG
jgi:hypothetical protein